MTNYNKNIQYTSIYIIIIFTLFLLFASSLYKDGDIYLFLFFFLIFITPVIGAIYKNKVILDGYAYGFLSITLSLILTYFYCKEKYKHENLQDFEIYTYLLLPASFGYNLSKINWSKLRKLIYHEYMANHDSDILVIILLSVTGFIILILSIFSFIFIDKNFTSIIAGTFLAIILNNTLNKLNTFEPK